MHSSTCARSAGRCAVINRDSMQTTSKMCKAEFFPNESSFPRGTHRRCDGRRFALPSETRSANARPEHRPSRIVLLPHRVERISPYLRSILRQDVRRSYITFCLISIHARDHSAVYGVCMRAIIGTDGLIRDISFSLPPCYDSGSKRYSKYRKFSSSVSPVRCRGVNKLAIVLSNGEVHFPRAPCVDGHSGR